MPQFVSSLRAVDEWKRIHAKRADAITQAEYDANAKYIKSPFARSLHIEDLVRFLDDTVLDIDFMVQLPSIEKCLEQWWELYSKGKPSIDQDQLRIVYFDLAFVLVEAKTETIHKNAVSMILRSSWTKWNPKEPPLSQIEFFRLLFILCHLMTTTNRLGDYVVFFQETLSKIRRHYQSKHTRIETRKRPPKSRRKSSLIDIMAKANRPRVYLSSNQIVEQSHANEAQFNSRGFLEALSVKVDRVQTQGRATRLEDETADRFVEILDRNSRGQHVVIDPLLHEKRFQEKWKRSNLVGNKSSSQEMVINQNPLTNKYYPPMFISRVRTNLSPSSAMMSQCKSVPALKLKCNMSYFEGAS
uniref:Uncharacterized protein n=1 Tax=Globisporangium ultimum (strain ATCC 200006 / CBS 805.95 / DAOM BR144) TaxID=431595 RepID=K3X2C5_GLOUD